MGRERVSSVAASLPAQARAVSSGSPRAHGGQTGGAGSPGPGATGRTRVLLQVKPRQGAPLRAVTSSSRFQGLLDAVPAVVPSEVCVMGTEIPAKTIGSKCVLWCATPTGSFCSGES